ncbi:MAG: arylsulfatase [Bacteroidales bacterium]|nr:arylsulfatase [Bacteroidales bacterium]
MIKNVMLLSMVFVCISCSQVPEKKDISEKPNVLLIITDDQGYGDLGYHGNPDIITPGLDQLASESVRFTNFYVCPVCAPTRSTILTGRYHPRTGVYDTYNGGAIMATEELTIAEILRENGYATGIFGKWHLGDNYPFRPEDQGFTTSLIHPGGGMGQVADIYNFFRGDSSYFDPVLLENGKKSQKRGYCSDIFANGAINFIRKHKNEPFFAYLSFNAPHTPLQVPEEYYAMYKNIEFDTSKYAIKGHPINQMDSNQQEAARKVYAMVSNIDDNINQLFWELDNLGLRKNTLVIFLTDNGPQQIRYTAGLRGRKGNVYEGGIRVPFFMDIPGEQFQDKDVQISGAHIDLLPTILEYCELDLPENVELDGKSLWPVIRGDEVDWKDRALFFHWQRGMPEPYQNIAVRKGDYKLVGKTEYTASAEDLELYNIKEDPFEQYNLIEDKLEKARELKADFDSYYASIIHNNNLNPQRIHLDGPDEYPVILNRNDAKGPPGIWAQDRIYAYWAVRVGKQALYNMNFVFRDNIPGEGKMLMKVGPVQRTIDFGDTTSNSIQMRNVPLLEGDFLFDAWFLYRGETYLPFYVEVTSQPDSEL